MTKKEITLSKFTDFLLSFSDLSTTDKMKIVNSFLKLDPKIATTTKMVVIKSLDHRKSDFVELLRPYVKEYSEVLMNEFYSYWTEHGVNDNKMRFEKQTSFDISRRLGTFKKNEVKYNKSNGTLTAAEKLDKELGL